MKRLLLVPALFACLTVVSVAQSDSAPGGDSAGRPDPGGSAVALFDPPAGRYEKNVLLSLGGSVGETAPARSPSATRSRRLEYRVSGVGASDFVGYQGPLQLSALPGEQRTYRVTARVMDGDEVLREEEARYTIDRRLPPAPEISELSGFYREPVEVGLAAPRGASVYYAVEGAGFSEWDGTDIRLAGEAGARVEYLVEAFSRFGDGPAGPVSSRRIVIDRVSAEPPSGIKIGSPVAGAWANRQLLYVEETGFSEIRYTTDGSDPSRGGTLYEGPVLLETDGTARLRVRGVTESGEAYRESLEFSAGSRQLLEVEQGVRTESFELGPPSDGVYRYRRSSGDAAAETGALFSRPISLTVQRGSRRGAEVRVDGPVDRRDEAASFRYFFLLDGRVPTPPEVTIDVDGRDALVSMTGSRGAAVEYEVRIDGSSVSEGSYDGPIEVTLPAGRESGEIEVTAVSAYGDARVSEPATVRRTFDSSPPAVPSLELPEGGPAASVLLPVRAEAESTVLYEIAFDSEPGEPDSFSPRLKTTSPLLALPHGVEGRAFIRLRARDDEGNLSASSPVYRVELDARPPQPPRIMIDRNVARLAGDGMLYYALHDGVTQGGGAGVYAPYEGPLRLGGRAGEKLRYELTAYARDEAGNRSRTVTVLEEVDRRIPRVPAAMSVTDGAHYAEPEVRFQVSGTAEDLNLHYTATTDGSEPPEPKPEDAVVPRDGVAFAAPEGSEVPVHLKVVPRFAGSDVTGRVREIRFAIDRRAPELPAISGIEAGGSYPAPRRLELQPADPGADDITVVLRETVGGGQTSESTFRYSEPILLSGRDGRETLYEIDLRVTDPAGNSRSLEEPIRTVVDRSAPVAGEIVLTGEDGTSIFGMATNGPVVLRPSSDRIMRYELAEDGAPPAPVSSSSPLIGEGLRLPGRSGGEVLYRVAYRSEDAAGNLSQETARLVMEIDRRPPPPPAAPSIRVAEDGRSARLAWSAEPGYRTGFRVVDEDEGEFRGADERSEVSFPPGDARVTVEAMQVDEVGNRSETRQFEVRGFTVSPRPELGGVRPGETYGETVVLRNRTPDATVRYELATGDDEPDEPTRFSEELPETLPFDVSPGETLRYTVHARAFDAGSRPSGVVRLSFTVDRTPPPPPELVNARSGDFYTGSRMVELDAPEGEIRYRLSLVQEEAGDFRPYEDQVMLNAVRGRLAHYQLEAYVVDGAGNRSGTPRVWDLYIDQEIVYVSVDGGADDPDSGAAADGGRETPFSSLSEAVDFALSRERRTIFVSSGSYQVSVPLRVDGDLTIQGGLSSETWRRADGRVTEIVTSDTFSGAALFDVRNASLTLERLGVTAEGVAALDTERGTIFMQGVSMTSEGAPLTLGLVDSTVEARNSDIRAHQLTGDAAVSLEESSASLQGVTIEAESSGGDYAVIHADRNSELEILNGSVTAGSGRRSAALRVDASIARIHDSELRAGPARESSDVIRARGSDVLLRESRLAASEGASISTAISTSGGELRLERNTVEVEGERGATGLFARGSRVTASRNAFRSGETSEFLHVVSLRDVTATVDTNLFLSGRSREVIVGRIVGSETSWYNNTIRGGVGSRFTQGFNLNGSSRATLVNNVVFHAGEGTGTAVYASEDVRSLEITANAFAGWDAVYRRAPDGRRWLPPGGDPASEARTAGALDRRDDLRAGSNLDLAEQDVFVDDVHLRSDAPLIDAGVYAGSLEGPRIDWDGQERPRPGEGTYDIGADEFFR
ncbi:MAG: hypothetical protein GVY14_00545 [Spirochaetes bacterium]|jgi:hypothetical protein|nr:hypothetical protein [Spirochaetota bacterium]